MRKFYILMIMVLATVSSFAQVPSAYALRVINETNCFQYFSISGDEPCNCGTNYSSPIIAIAPGSILNYPDSTTLGGTFPALDPKGIVVARILDGINFCMSNVGVIGQSVCGFPATFYFDTLASDCTVCSHTRAHWFEALNSCNVGVTLVFS